MIYFCAWMQLSIPDAYVLGFKIVVLMFLLTVERLINNIHYTVQSMAPLKSKLLRLSFYWAAKC